MTQEVTYETAYLHTPITFLIRSCITAEQNYDGPLPGVEESDYPSGLFVGSFYTIADHIYVEGGYNTFAYIGPRKPPQPGVEVTTTEGRIRWAKVYDGFSVQVLDELNNMDMWSDVIGVPVEAGEFFELRFPIDGTSKFFRLIKNCDPAIKGNKK